MHRDVESSPPIRVDRVRAAPDARGKIPGLLLLAALVAGACGSVVDTVLESRVRSLCRDFIGLPTSEKELSMGWILARLGRLGSDCVSSASNSCKTFAVSLDLGGVGLDGGGWFIV